MIAVYKKELKSFFQNIMGFVFIAFMLLMIGIFTIAANFASLYPNFEYALFSSLLIFPFLIPILTMRSIAEEKRQRTEQLLFSAPVRISDIVLGKYFAMITIILIPMLIVCTYPLIISRYGAVSFGPAYSAIIAFFLLGCALTAIGMFVSSLTENQIVAAIITLALMLLLYFMKNLIQMMTSSAVISLIMFGVFAIAIAFLVYSLTHNIAVSAGVGFVLVIALVLLYSFYPEALSSGFITVLNSISIFSRYDNFYFGILDLSSLVYFISVAVLFVFFTIQSIEKRRWN